LAFVIQTQLAVHHLQCAGASFKGGFASAQEASLWVSQAGVQIKASTLQSSNPVSTSDAATKRAARVKDGGKGTEASYSARSAGQEEEREGWVFRRLIAQCCTEWF